jgi:uncharacterized protein with HEPN domain
MRPDRLLLLDIVAAADAILVHISGRERDAFIGDPTVRAAVLYEVIVIGEAAGRASPELRSRHPEIPWAEVIGFRNVVVHEYFGISWPVVWVTATVEVPDLRTKVSAILDSEFPEAGREK